MAVPVFEEEKMASLGFLTYAYVIEWPLQAVRRRLGRLRGLLCTFSSLQASKVATRELRLLEYMVILEREASAQICEGIMRGGHFWQLGSIVSLVTENYRWGDSSSIVAQTWPQERSQSA